MNCQTLKKLLYVVSACWLSSSLVFSQITERPRPKEWDRLVEGARFIDRFLPMPEGRLSDQVWGGDNVRPRYIDNGIEDAERSYWGGNIIQGDDGLYHLFVCGWPENSPKGHHTWPQSVVYHAVCSNSIGPYAIRDTIGPGHNPEIFRASNGQYAVYVIDGYYLSDNLDGPWECKHFDFDPRGRRIIEGLSNLTFARREDGSNLMICRGGGVWISRTGLSTYCQLTDKRVYPDVAGEFEDPVVWKDAVQYHLIVNDWLGRIAFYLRSKDGVNWVTDPGEAYLPGIISRHQDGTVENWFKYERIKILQDEYGRAIQANFAVIDTLKNEDLPNDRHSSKNLSIPLNPGMLLTMLNDKPITSQTREIRIRIAAEKDFLPQKDLDLTSLRFGASSEVNYGRGCKVRSTLSEGNDLIVVFDAAGNGIGPDEFAPKMIGRKKSGEMVYGYTRLPGVDYTPAILSARVPEFKEGKMSVTVENFGLKTSGKAGLRVYLVQEGRQQLIAESSVPPLESYGKTTVVCKTSFVKKQGRKEDFVVSIRCGKETSDFHFSQE